MGGKSVKGEPEEMGKKLTKTWDVGAGEMGVGERRISGNVENLFGFCGVTGLVSGKSSYSRTLLLGERSRKGGRQVGRPRTATLRGGGPKKLRKSGPGNFCSV